MRRCAQCQVDYPDALAFCPDDGTALPSGPGDGHADPLIGTTIDGRYAVESVLGEGGMGMVYAGRHVIIDKRVAIKVLRKDAAADSSASQRFLAEAKAASKIGQQNIVDITDFGVLSDGHAYFVMEFLDGPTLGGLLKGGPLPPRRAVAISIQIARGLVAAHDKGIIHRDLKPENVFVFEREGVADMVKIVDFGIARDASAKKRLTVAGMVMGTPEYMAPEQASGQETDHRVDQYALGCILYEMVTGGTPFRGENPMQTLTMHVREPVEPPSVRRPDLLIPAVVEEIILRAMQKQRDARYPTLEQMMRAMQACEASLPAMLPKAAARTAPTAVVRAPLPAGGAPNPHGRTVAQAVAPRGWIVPVALGVVMLSVGGVLLVRAMSPKATSIVPVVVSPAVERPATNGTTQANAPPEQQPEKQTVRLQLSSTPAGAEVFFGDEQLGVTPLETRQPRRDVPLMLVFRKAGFEPLAHLVAVGSDADVAVALVPKPTSGRADSRKMTKHSTQTGDSSKTANTKAPDKNAGDAPPKHRVHTELRDPFADPPQ